MEPTFPVLLPLGKAGIAPVTWGSSVFPQGYPNTSSLPGLCMRGLHEKTHVTSCHLKLLGSETLSIDQPINHNRTYMFK